MSCNRQNFRPVNTGYRPGCAGQGGIVVGTAVNDRERAGCGTPCANALLEEQPLGMAYVPWQTFGEMYPMRQGLNRGTMFPCLDFDFMGRRCN